tara:strand:+ start:4359 stop:4940 length:582 start_codon:yes stop_codon:yes gene_type:complete
MVAKELLRKRLRNERKEIGAEERARRSESIALNCLKFLKDFPKVQHIHVFLPIKRLYEVNTVPLLRRLFKLEYRVYSSVTLHGSRKMAIVKLTADTVYETDKLGIPVPKSPEFVTDAKLIDLVFVPLLGVDTLGNRLGYGQGFYDTFFKELDSNVLKIGLSFEAPMPEEIPHETHDVPLDACIHPDGSILFKK